MWLSATINAYDVMGGVQVTATVRSQPGLGEARPESVLHCATTIEGCGETDPREWLGDALVAMLESL